MIYIISNRNVNTSHSDEHLFGDDFNSLGQDVLRFAKVTYSSEWQLDLFADTDDHTEPSHTVFETLYADEKPCVVFIHGFNQSLAKNLAKAREIEAYGVNVLAFSWPSNPGPQFLLRRTKEYKRARKNARRSAFALELFLDMLSRFVDAKGNAGAFKTLAIHSLGNYLAESFVRNPDFAHQTSLFKNILLHQADVNSAGHELWVDDLGRNSRVIITINETDDVLDFSDIINPDRLGNTVANLSSEFARYYDFTNARGCNDVHRLWSIPPEDNQNINVFFHCVFQGKNINRTGMAFNPALNCFELE